MSPPTCRAAFAVVLLAAAPLAADTRKLQNPFGRPPEPQRDARDVRPLDGTWQFRKDADPADRWADVTVPSSFPAADGVGWYQKVVEPFALPAGRRALLHFQAAATEAEVWWNGARLGAHAGAWAPFRFDVTEPVRAAGPGAKHTLRVRVAGADGGPDFAGLWQGVRLLIVPQTYIDDLNLKTIPDPAAGDIEVRFPVAGSPRAVGDTPRANSSEVRPAQHVKQQLDRPDREDLAHRIDGLKDENGVLSFRVRVPKAEAWSPESPRLYELRVGCGVDAVVTRVAFRTIEARGDRLLLNGRPLGVRGVLDRGRYPSRADPNAGEAAWVKDFELARELGFNLVKCVGWVPPPRYLELADECGLLVWVDHPDRQVGKPPVTVEAIAAATWPDPQPLLHRQFPANSMPGRPDAGAVWLERMSKLTGLFDDRLRWAYVYGSLEFSCGFGRRGYYGRGGFGHDNWIGTDQFVQESKLYAHLGRKFQAEAARRDGPAGGHVVGELRDGPGSGAGLIDGQGQPKWSKDDWNWHRDTMLLLKADGDRRSFRLGEKFEPALYVSHFGPRPLAAQVHRAMQNAENSATEIKSSPDLAAVEPGALKGLGVVPFALSGEAAKLTLPVRWTLQASLQADGKNVAENAWPVWLVPPRKPIGVAMVRHESMPQGLFDELFPGAKPPSADDPADGIVVARKLDARLLEAIELGDRVLLLPDGGPNSPPLAAHRFARGGPFVAPHPALANVPRQMIVELQQFDLAGGVIPEFARLDEVEPIVLLWDRHEGQAVGTQVLVFEAKVGQGRLFVSALNHAGKGNAAGQYLLDQFARHVGSNHHPVRALSADARRRLREKIDERTIDLSQASWLHRPDPRDEGLTGNWHKPNRAPDAAWQPVRLGGKQPSPSRGWYRVSADVPADWDGRAAFVTVDAAGGAYELYVNGELAGAGGDHVRRVPAAGRKSHDVTPLLKPGAACVIALRADDWQGGATIGAVTLGTARRDGGAQILR